MLRLPAEENMEKQLENETNHAVESSDQAGVLNEKELDQVSGGDESPKETVTFEYGGLHVQYIQQKP